MDCQRVRETIYLAGDNQLEPDLLLSFREHLSLCPGCADRFAYVGRLLTTVRQRCCRYTAPSSLKLRIINSFPHRGASRVHEALD